jgi:hypothetical protein
MKLAIIIACTLASGAFAGIAVVIGVSTTKSNPLLAIPFAFVFMVGLAGSAWLFSPDGPLAR